MKRTSVLHGFRFFFHLQESGLSLSCFRKSGSFIAAHAIRTIIPVPGDGIADRSGRQIIYDDADAFMIIRIFNLIDRDIGKFRIIAA